MTGSDIGHLGPEKVSYAPGPLGERMDTEPGGRFSCDGSGETKVWGDTGKVDAGAVGWIEEHGSRRGFSKEQAGSG